ncbi:MAG: sugar phosphate nucleotidyltransferase [Ignavibacteria bacterium]
MNKAVIMAGGFGTRLRPLTMSIPKPMVPIANIPIMEHIVNLLKRHNITDITALLYYQPDRIKQYFGDGSKFGITMQYVQADADYGTAGSVRNAMKECNEPFLVMSGDVLTDIDLTSAIAFHEEHASKATILLSRVQDPLHYGIVMTQPDGKISQFLEKPSWGEVFTDTINTGMYILEPEIISMIPPERDYDFGKDVFPHMLRSSMDLFGCITQGYWKDIGNLHEYQSACHDVLQEQVGIQITGTERPHAIVADNAVIPDTVSFSGKSVIGNDVTIGNNSKIHQCIIGDGVHIGSGVQLNNCIIWDAVHVGDRVMASDDVICNDVFIDAGVTINEQVFIAELCHVGSGSHLLSNIKLWPKKIIESGAIVTRSLVQEEIWLRELITDSRISGLANVDINPEFAAKLGACIGNALGMHANVAASRDADAASRMVHRALISGLMSTGITVRDLQITPIPQARQDLRAGTSHAGFHVRRSIRKPDTIDIILFNHDGRDIPHSISKTIERYFFGEDIKRVPYNEVGSIIFPERSNETYASRFSSALNVSEILQSNYRLLIDYSNGLASTTFPVLLGSLGVHVVSVNSYVDTLEGFSDERTDTEAEETSEIIQSLGYDFGFKIDASAEKIAVVDGHGQWYQPNRLLTILTKLFLEAHKHREPYAIAVPVLASTDIERIAADYDVEVIRIKNSHSAMMEATKDSRILFCGDTRGRFIFTDYLFASDGMFSLAKCLEMLASTSHTFSDLHAQLPYRSRVHYSISCPWEKKGIVMRKAMEFTEHLSRVLIDGITVNEDNATIVLLPDKERPAFVVAVEADSEEKAQHVAELYKQHIMYWSEAS